METSAIGTIVGIATLAIIGTLLWLSHKLTQRGWFKNYSRGLGRGLFEVETMLRPSRQHVREAKEGKKNMEEGQGGPGPDPP